MSFTPPMNPMMGQMAGPMMGQGPMTGPMDPVMAQLMQGPRIVIDPDDALPERQKKGYVPMPDEGYIKEVINKDQEYYRPLLDRFSRDLSLYRQKNPPSVPPGFDWKKEIAFKSATISNVVNKLANMMSAGDWRHVVPFKDEASKRNSQIVENWYSYCRQCEEEAYAEGGGDASLQYDESWYLLQYGRAVARIVPDPSDPFHPFNDSLLDPSTCFPVFGDSKDGMVRMTRSYETTVANVIKTYGAWNAARGSNLEEKLLDAVGISASEIGRFYTETGTLDEYWDTWNRAVYFKDVEIMRDSHKLGYVPFVYVIARGEPRGVVTPEGDGVYYVDENDNAIGVMTKEDISEKGISVFHHLVNTNKYTDLIYTLLLTQVLQSRNPATITYSLPQMAGELPPPIAYFPGANNQRVLNAQKVEIVPTSPRPTDTSPVLNKVQADTVEGSINPAMYGSMDGSNIAGFAVESLISAARDTILPYIHAFHRFQALKAKMRGRQYVKILAPNGVQMSVAMEGRYGSSPSADLTPEIVRSTGYKVTVEAVGVSDSALPGLMNLAATALDKGIKTRRWAMEKTGSKDPDKDYRDIIAERAIEHPEVMENFIIPQIFIQNGQKELAWVWGFMVVMPKLMQTMGQMMGGMMPPGIPGGPGGMSPPGGMAPPGMAPPPSPAGMNGQSNPIAGRRPAPPTGPLPGQGRGPA